MSEDKEQEIEESTGLNKEQDDVRENEKVTEPAALESKPTTMENEEENDIGAMANAEPVAPIEKDKGSDEPSIATDEKIPIREEKGKTKADTTPKHTASDKNQAEIDVEIPSDEKPLATAEQKKQAEDKSIDGEHSVQDKSETSEAEKTQSSNGENNSENVVLLDKKQPKKEAQEEDTEEALAEIDEENAEDAEDHDNKHRHAIPLLDYHEMSMENLVGELQRLVRNEKVQAIKKHVDGIKHEFDQKFQEFIEGKKEDFIASGGNEIDFRYNSVTKRQFNEVYSDYREKRNQYYKNLESTLKDNLAKRLEIIEELKGLISVEEDMNTTYNTFKELQQRWRNAGAIPRNQYNDVWRTYHHHIEMFYDFLHLNRELRDLDFKHNLEEKTKLVERAEALIQEKDLGKAFRELQELHKLWKEEIGPVAREERDAIWNKFSDATKALHNRRQEHQKELDKKYEENLIRKNEIIEQIGLLAENTASNHRALQEQIKQIADLREQFFKAGKVPQKANEATWKAFKDATRNFNRNKNAYYKNLKKEQQQNLDKKRELVALALSLKDSEDWDTATPEFKRIQNDWKKIGHVPRKYSDAIWKEFKNACNHYFDRLHALKNSAHKEEEANLKKKIASLDKLRNWKPSGEKEKDLAALKETITEWKGYGRVPFKQKHIDQKFSKVLDGLFKKIGVDKQESELLRYGNKIQQLASSQDQGRALGNERQFIRKKISESKNEILQLENNLQFFKHAADDNPMVMEVVKNIERHRTSLKTWQGKLKKLNIMENNLNKAAEEEAHNEVSNSEEE
ncbi:DUF349 domain-containing protein [Aggregatimonas sangjinii]|nr:DUF349 domain-containing protein [Aggregatimonas sangjinii]